MCLDCSEPVHHHFGLTYASYHVVQRSVLQAMPVEWQRKFVELMLELESAARNLTDRPESFWVRATDDGRFVADPYAPYRHTRLTLAEPEKGLLG